MNMTNHVPAAAGALVAIVMNLNGWWLDDGSRVRNLLIVLALSALAVGFIGDARRTVQREVALWLGFVIAMTVILFVMGPGTIFPIVIAVGAVMAAVTVGVGAAPALLRR